MRLPAGWEARTLTDFIELQRGFDLPHRTRRPGPYKVLTSGEAHGWHDEAKVTAPGFVVGRASNIGRPTWSDEDFWPLNTTLFAKDFKGNDPKFAYYWFLGNDLSAYNSGSVQAMLNRNYIANVPIIVPPVEEQRTIAATLGALDDKIESNRRITRDALELAKQITLKMTSDRPKVHFSSALEVRMGAAFKGDDFSAYGIGRPLLRIRDLKTFESQTWTTEHRNDETVINPGDIVVGMDAEFRATLWLGRESVLNQRVCLFRGKEGVSRAFVLTALEPELAFQEQAKTGTTVIHLNKSDIDRFTVPSLTPGEHAELTRLTEPLMELAVARALESRFLVSLRDVLLPALLTGRISTTPEHVV